MHYTTDSLCCGSHTKQIVVFVVVDVVVVVVVILSVVALVVVLVAVVASAVVAAVATIFSVAMFADQAGRCLVPVAVVLVHVVHSFV